MGLRQKSWYISLNCIDRIDISSYILYAIEANSIIGGGHGRDDREFGEEAGTSV